MKHSLQQIAAFAETARHGSFAAAARELGSAPSTLAKSVARLEVLHEQYRADYQAYYDRHATADSPAIRGADPAIVLMHRAVMSALPASNRITH